MTLSSRRELLQTMPKGGLAVEVGTLHGDFAQEILEVLRPDRLILVDTWQDYQNHNGDASYEHVRARFCDHPLVEAWRGNSVEMLARLADRSVSFAYVDADHEYVSCLADLEALLPKMQPGGWLCGHDYCQANDFGVIRAVAVFCDRHGLSINRLTDEPPGPWLEPSGYQPKEVCYNSFGIRIP